MPQSLFDFLLKFAARHDLILKTRVHSRAISRSTPWKPLSYPLNNLATFQQFITTKQTYFFLFFWGGGVRGREESEGENKIKYNFTPAAAFAFRKVHSNGSFQGKTRKLNGSLDAENRVDVKKLIFLLRWDY